MRPGDEEHLSRVFGIAAIYVVAAPIGSVLGGATGLLIAWVVASILAWVWISHWRKSLPPS